MSDMDTAQLIRARDVLVAYLVKRYPMELPDTHFDGTPLTDVKDIAVAAGIPEWEVNARLGRKDVYSGSGGTQSVPAMSTMSRSRQLARVNKEKRKQKKRRVEVDCPTEVVGRALSTRKTKTTSGTQVVWKHD